MNEEELMNRIDALDPLKAFELLLVISTHKDELTDNTADEDQLALLGRLLESVEG